MIPLNQGIEKKIGQFVYEVYKLLNHRIQKRIAKFVYEIYKLLNQEIQKRIAKLVYENKFNILTIMWHPMECSAFLV